MTSTTLGYAFLGGLLPSFIWLYFLLKEDATHPEPKALIAFAFITGMLAVPIAIPLEQWACWRLALDPLTACTLGKPTWLSLGPDAITSWAVIEELLKYIMAAVFILWRRAVDEAPDYVIYMVTVALGFAAAENMLFLIAPLTDSGQFAPTFFTGDLRFLGSTLLHVVASGAIGFAFAFSAGKRPFARIVAAAVGVILAIALHTAFNTLIINTGASNTLNALFLVWIVAVIFFAAFEVLKYFQYRKFSNHCSL